VEQKTEKEEC